jgi:hypothetical protein
LNTFFNELFQQSVAAHSSDTTSPNNSSNNDGTSSPTNMDAESKKEKVVDQNVYEFLSKIEKQNRILKQISFSDTYNDIVASILTERSPTAATSYNSAAAGNGGSYDANKTASSEDDLESSVNYSYVAAPPAAAVRRNSFLLKQRRSVAPSTQPVVKSNIKTTRIKLKSNSNNNDSDNFERNLTSAAQPVLFVDEIMPLVEKTVKLNPTVAMARISTAKSTARVASSASSSFKSMTVSNGKSSAGTSAAQTPLSMASSNGGGGQHRQSPLSRSSTRLSDLMFNGCKRAAVLPLADSSPASSSYDTFNSDSVGSRGAYDDDTNLLTPSFRVKRFNIRDERQLELAKRDIFKRYAIISIPVLRAMSTMPQSSGRGGGGGLSSRRTASKLVALVK